MADEPTVDHTDDLPSDAAETGTDVDESPAKTVPVAAEPASAEPASAEAPAKRPNPRKVREGIVSSSSMDKTVVVKVVERVRHPRYAKTLQHTTKLYVDDPANSASRGDRVRIAETRPLSKLKRWRLLEILERAK